MERLENHKQLEEYSANEKQTALEKYSCNGVGANSIQEDVKCGCKRRNTNSDIDIKVSQSYVYTLGRVEPRFPNLAVEKEFTQATGRTETAGMTNRQALHTVLSKPENRYLARLMCYVLTVEGLETYILKPDDPMDFNTLVEAIRPTPRLTDVDVVIGRQGPIASPEMCNGLMIPIVMVDQIYSFDIDGLISSIPRPDTIAVEKFNLAAEELFSRIIQIADNAGAMDEHRALNYLAVRYSAFYGQVAEMYGRNFALTAVDVYPSRLSNIRKIVNVVTSFTNRVTDIIEKYYIRVDVTEEFPFLMTKMSPYYDR